MAQTVADVMTADPMTIEADVEISAAAQQMRDNDVGSIVVQDHGQLLGVVTGRDIVVRLVAAQRELTTPVGQICTGGEIHAVTPQTPLRDAVQLMRAEAVRRLAVVDGDQVVGIVSLGDLAIERGERSALADISATHPNT